jgi:uncharacterized protein YvpB
MPVPRPRTLRRLAEQNRRAFLRGERITEALALAPVPELFPVTKGACCVVAMRAVLAKYGQDISETLLANLLETDPVAGTHSADVVALAEALGCPVENRVGLSLDDLVYCLQQDIPVICLVTKDGENHAVVVTGIDQTSVTFLDPGPGYASMPRDEFVNCWTAKATRGPMVGYGIAIGPSPSWGAHVDLAPARESLAAAAPAVVPPAAIAALDRIADELAKPRELVHERDAEQRIDRTINRPLDGSEAAADRDRQTRLQKLRTGERR